MGRLDIKLRPPAPDDLPALRELFLDVRRRTFHWVDPEAYQLADYDSACAGETQVVAEHGGEVVGFVSWWPPENFLHSLFVAGHAQGQGVGKLLLDECLARMGRPAQLKCVTRNAGAVRFYESHGWHPVETGQDVEGEYLLMRLNAS